MSVLENILKAKHDEVSSKKDLYPIKLLERSPYFCSPTVSLTTYLQRGDASGIIAEIKKASPTRGKINPHISVEKLSIGYMQQGASALSVLTDASFFGGSLQDLRTARRCNFCPILRKDFIVDEYQIFEARSFGADVILLIARILSPSQVRELSQIARSLNLEVLLEVHSAAELTSHVTDSVSVIGVNARNLDSLQIDETLHERLASSLPKNMCAVAESGISEPASVNALKKVGYKGFLIGERFMVSADPAKACGNFIREVRSTHAG